MFEIKEKYKVPIVSILIFIATFLTYYFHAVLKTGIIFTHFFYIPIILSAIWWKRKGIFVALLLIVVLFLGVSVFAKRVPGIDDIVRAFMFLVISSVVIVLSEKIAQSEKLLQKAHDDLSMRTAELEKKNIDLETMLKSFVGRELRMKELKEQIAKLEKDIRDNRKSAHG